MPGEFRQHIKHNQIHNVVLFLILIYISLFGFGIDSMRENPKGMFHLINGHPVFLFESASVYNNSSEMNTNDRLQFHGDTDTHQ